MTTTFEERFFDIMMNTSGDGYVTCSQGHTHWGRYGAAGLLVFTVSADGEPLYLLQKRSPDVHLGGTWSTPGGALHYGEHPVAGALREANEELPLPQPLHLGPELDHIATLTDDHGGWSYATVIMKSERMFSTGTEHTSWESDGAGWFFADELEKLPLHPGFAVAFPGARATVEEYKVFTDGSS
jgi:8-oxo-dGTP pyrophosphatase MutT (NUDIX family)